MSLALKISILIGCLMWYSCVPANEDEYDDPCEQYLHCGAGQNSENLANEEAKSEAAYLDLMQCAQWTKALQEIRSVLGDSSGLGSGIKSQMMTAAAEILWKQGEDEEAEKLLEAAAALTTTEDSDYSRISYNRGEIFYIRHFVKGQPTLEEAKKWHYQALKLRLNGGDSTALTHSLSRIGVIHERERNIDSALHYYHRAIAISEAKGYDAGKTRPYTHLGFYHRNGGDTLQALAHFEKALLINKEHQNFEVLPFNIVNLSWLQGGDFTAMRSEMECSLRIARKIEFKLAVVNTLFNLGRLAEGAGQIELAQDYYQQMLKESQQWNYITFETLAQNRLNTLVN